MHIVQFDEESQNYHHAIARDEKEAGELIDNGWTYILTTQKRYDVPKTQITLLFY